MIKYSFLTAFILFLSYYLIIKFNPNLSASQNQWQDNTIKAQQYIYNNVTQENVIIGTSLSNKLVMDSLKGFVNLAFGGESVYEGLNVLFLKEKLPNNVYIEMNVALKPENEDFKFSISNPILLKAKKHLYCLREDKQPIANLGSYINKSFTKEFLLNIKPSVAGNNSQLFSNEAFAKILHEQKNKYKKEPEPEIVKSSFDKLTTFVTKLRQAGVNVVFFEMPIHEELAGLPRANKIRNLFFKNFPQSSYKYILMPSDLSNYKTIDGIHLNKNELVKYTSFFKSESEKLKK